MQMEPYLVGDPLMDSLFFEDRRFQVEVEGDALKPLTCLSCSYVKTAWRLF